MNKKLLQKFFQQVETTEVSIVHTKENKTLLSVNSYQTPENLASNLNSMLNEVNLSIYDDEKPDKEFASMILHHLSKTYEEHQDIYFETFNNRLINKNIIINDNLKGQIKYKDLSEELKDRIQAFNLKQKEFFDIMLASINFTEEENTNNLNPFPYPFRGTQQHLVSLLEAIYYSNYFLTPEERKRTTPTKFINTLFDQLNITRATDLRSIISNIKRIGPKNNALRNLEETLFTHILKE